jgi:carbon-monoxide dehydrogenase large subunit
MGASDFSKLPHIGESLRRKEDYRFLTGAGNYTDDITMEAQSYAIFVRSPHAHATIKSIDISAAEKMPGVVKSSLAKTSKARWVDYPAAG